MRHSLKTVMFLLFIFPCCAFSLNVGDSFQQLGIDILNDSSQQVLLTDASEPELQSKLIPLEDYFSVEFSPNQFTVPSGQTFTHDIEIHSAVDNKLICTIKTKVVVDQSGAVEESKLVSTNESKCSTSVNDDDYDVVISDGSIWNWHWPSLMPQ